MARCTGPDGPYHDYEDLSCCHDLISYESLASLITAIGDARSVLDRIMDGRPVVESEINSALAGLESVELEHVQPLNPNRCRFPGCTGVYHPDHATGETGWQFDPAERDDVPAHDHYGVAL